MKKIAIILSLVGLLVTSCEEDEIPTPSFTDVTWYSSVPLILDGVSQIKEGRAISIHDLSQNALSHEWIIEEGTFFLESGFDNNTNNNIPDPDLTPFIDETKGLSSTDETVFILFPTATEVGEFYTITIRNTFPEKVVYNGSTPIEAVQEGDVWVFEYTFNVQVNPG